MRISFGDFILIITPVLYSTFFSILTYDIGIRTGFLSFPFILNIIAFVIFNWFFMQSMLNLVIFGRNGQSVLSERDSLRNEVQVLRFERDNLRLSNHSLIAQIEDLQKESDKECTDIESFKCDSEISVTDGIEL
jgi:hypothetical protein